MSIFNIASLDNRQRRIFRLAFGVTVSSAVAIGVGWPLSYMAPMLVASILGGSDMPLGVKKSVAMLLVIFAGLFSGMLFSNLFMGQPALACILLTVVFYWIYYFSNRGLLPNFAGVMLIIGMTAMPLMVQVDSALGSVFFEGFLMATAIALLFAGLANHCFPHQTEVDEASSEKVAGKSHNHSLRIAGISTLVVMPMMVYFLTFNLLSSALIIVFIAILSLNPALDQGKKAGIGLLIGNGIGGLVAMVFYNLMKTAPHFDFYLLLLGTFSLWVAMQANSGKKMAALWGMALSTFLVLTGPIFSGEGDDAGDKFSTRLLQIGAAAVYIIMAFRLTAEMWPKEEDEKSARNLKANTAAEVADTV